MTTDQSLSPSSAQPTSNIVRKIGGGGSSLYVLLLNERQTINFIIFILKWVMECRLLTNGAVGEITILHIQNIVSYGFFLYRRQPNFVLYTSWSGCSVFAGLWATMMPNSWACWEGSDKFCVWKYYGRWPINMQKHYKPKDCMPHQDRAYTASIINNWDCNWLTTQEKQGGSYILKKPKQHTTAIKN